MNLKNKSNDYVEHIFNLFEKTPKAVFAAIAVSLVLHGGDDLQGVEKALVEEWNLLYENGIIEQNPSKYLGFKK